MRLRKIWVISDTHFGHENIIRYCNRPFKNRHEMDAAIVSNWNEAVQDHDIVYHLGDVYFPGGNEPDYFWKLLKSLKGRKRLVLGNHDDLPNKALYAHFQKIVAWRHFGGEYNCILTHMPLHIESSVFPDEGKPFNVHGHIHNNKSPTNKHINVSVEQTNYYPVDLEELMSKHK